MRHGRESVLRRLQKRANHLKLKSTIVRAQEDWFLDVAELLERETFTHFAWRIAAALGLGLRVFEREVPHTVPGMVTPPRCVTVRRDDVIAWMKKNAPDRWERYLAEMARKKLASVKR